MRHHYLSHCLFVIAICFLVSIAADEAIIGGENAEENQFPYQVSIFYEDNARNPACGGAILDDKHILTAAHCFMENGEFYPYRLFVLVATNNLRKTKEPAVIVEVERIFVPTEFNHFVTGTRGDIAVLELKESLELQKNKRHMRKVKLPVSRQETYAGKTATIASFGWNWKTFEDKTTGFKYGNNSDGRLRFAEADVLSHYECRYIFPKLHMTDKDLCARVKQRDNIARGVCNGDSGSSLVVDGGTVIGILSRVPVKCRERRLSGIYTRVSQYLIFIANALKGQLNRTIRTYNPGSQ